MKGFIYKGRLDETRLRELAGQLFGDTAFFHIVQDLDDYHPGSGLPVDFKRKGRLFAEIAELRYERTGDVFACLLLMEREIAVVPRFVFVPVPGDWKAIEAEQMLISTSEPYVNPLFKQYPDGTRRISVCVYRNQGIAQFTRLRRFVL